MTKPRPPKRRPPKDPKPPANATEWVRLHWESDTPAEEIAEQLANLLDDGRTLDDDEDEPKPDVP